MSSCPVVDLRLLLQGYFNECPNPSVVGSHAFSAFPLSLSYLDTDVLGAPDPSPASLASLSPPVVHEKARHPLARSLG